MLTLKIDSVECYDDEYGFYTVPGGTLTLEHSLISLSKFESATHKAFLDDTAETTLADTIEYIKCMTINKVDPNIYSILQQKDIDTINAYVNDPMTATKFSDIKTGSSRHSIITSEVIYYYMVSFNIPFECEKWHLNRLMTLIRVCSEKNNVNGKKMNRREIYEQNKRLNEIRRAKMKSKG